MNDGEKGRIGRLQRVLVQTCVDAGHVQKGEATMGWSARKKFGPFNISWSQKHGWNISAGAGGLRIGANKRGRYLSANKSLGGVRYSRRIALGTPQAPRPSSPRQHILYSGAE